MWGAHDGMGWWMVLGSVWFILFWGAAIYLIVAAGSRRGGERPPAETPLEILQRRYARGEITKEDFDRMRRELS